MSQRWLDVVLMEEEEELLQEGQQLENTVWSVGINLSKETRVRPFSLTTQRLIALPSLWLVVPFLGPTRQTGQRFRRQRWLLFSFFHGRVRRAAPQRAHTRSSNEVCSSPASYKDRGGEAPKQGEQLPGSPR